MAQSFTLFPRLPPELRLKIWHEALEVECESQYIIFDLKRRVLCPKRHNISPYLNLCRESRAEALGFYTDDFPVYIDCLFWDPWQVGLVYVNLARMTVVTVWNRSNASGLSSEPRLTPWFPKVTHVLREEHCSSVRKLIELRFLPQYPFDRWVVDLTNIHNHQCPNLLSYGRIIFDRDDYLRQIYDMHTRLDEIVRQMLDSIESGHGSVTWNDMRRRNGLPDLYDFGLTHP
ncbi:hypothetical protein F4819DRAFT_253346 [Hypoxylon fuscum]|nr:hypothetical protein F4819DRAFT_253346 [Hypoxylon fuscum]